MTAQSTELLIINGKLFSMPCLPDLPDISWTDRNGIPMLKHGSAISNTACYRGYKGAWEIRDRKLYLVDLKGKYIKTNEEPIFAKWINQELTVWIGEIIEYWHIGYDSLYEMDLIITIENGEVQDPVEVVDNRSSIKNNDGEECLPTTKNINFDKIFILDLVKNEPNILDANETFTFLHLDNLYISWDIDKITNKKTSLIKEICYDGEMKDNEINYLVEQLDSFNQILIGVRDFYAAFL